VEVEADDPLDAGDIQIVDGMYARAGQLAMDARVTDERTAQIRAVLPNKEFIIKVRIELIHTERKKGQDVIVISHDTKLGVLTGLIASCIRTPTHSLWWFVGSVLSKTHTLPTWLCEEMANSVVWPRES